MRLLVNCSRVVSLAAALSLHAPCGFAQGTTSSQSAVAPGSIGPDGAYRVGGGVKPPAVLTRVGPGIPDLAGKLRASGDVMVSLVVQADGSLRDIKVVRSAGYGMDERAIETVRKWRFKAGTKDGTAVDVRIQVEVAFRVAPEPNAWGAGPLLFDLGPGVSAPVLKTGSVPKPVRESGDETVLLQFTIGADGQVGDIRAVTGESSTSVKALTNSVSIWKFAPAFNDGAPQPVTAKIVFIKGEDQYRYEVSSAFRDSGSLRPPEQRLARGSSPSAPGTGGPVRMITVFPKLRLEPAEAEKLLVERVEPEYSAAAKQAGIQGTVLLALTIGMDGGVAEVQEISGPRELVPAAVAAVKRWRYRPTVMKGRAWEVSTEVEIGFHPSR